MSFRDGVVQITHRQVDDGRELLDCDVISWQDKPRIHNLRKLDARFFAENVRKVLGGSNRTGNKGEAARGSQPSQAEPAVARRQREKCWKHLAVFGANESIASYASCGSDV